jgi:hypothetical protein
MAQRQVRLFSVRSIWIKGESLFSEIFTSPLRSSCYIPLKIPGERNDGSRVAQIFGAAFEHSGFSSVYHGECL